MDVIDIHPDPDPRRFLRSFITEPLVADLAGIAGGPHTVASLETTLVSLTPEVPEGASRTAALAMGTTPSWAPFAEMNLIEGRFLEPGDAHGLVLDEWIARRIFGSGPAAGRDHLRAHRRQGDLVRSWAWPRIRSAYGTASIEMRSAARSVTSSCVSWSTRTFYVLRDTLGAGRPILFGLLSAAPGAEPADAVKGIRERLTEIGSTARAWDRKSWAQRILGATDEVAGIASFLWVAILAITALMASAIIAIAVRGRYREIAIRRVEGGTRAAILTQLLLENAMISVAAALPGFGLAALAARWLDERPRWPIPIARGRPRHHPRLGRRSRHRHDVSPAHRAASLSPMQVLARP